MKPYIDDIPSITTKNFTRTKVSAFNVPWTKMTLQTSDGDYIIKLSLDMMNEILTVTIHTLYSDYVTNVRVIRKPSNLGKGNTWYFECPITKHLCRKLYFIQGKAVSRYAIVNPRYKQQLRNHFTRLASQINKYESYPRKYGKEYYRGRLTPYGKVLARNKEKINKAYALLYYMLV